MPSKLIILFVASLALSIEAQLFKLEHKHYTSLQNALADAEKYILKINETKNFPSLAFGVSVKGKTVFEKAWGLADLENRIPAKIYTKYRICSTSKTIVSAIIADMVDKGLVHYDDPVSKYISESLFPAKKWQGQPVAITIRHLLSHSAGLHANVNSDFSKDEPVDNVTQTVKYFNNEPLRFKPGTNFEYSNYGFQMLGAIIESVTKKRCQDVMLDYMKHYGMVNSTIANVSLIIPDIARFYKPLSEHRLKENAPAVTLDNLIFVEGYWPAGGVISTVGDLLKYGQLLIDSYKGRKNAILSAKTVKEMWTVQVPTNSTHEVAHAYKVESDYGLGWIVGTNNHQMKHKHFVWHAGGLPGSSTNLLIWPDEEIVGVALMNKGSVLESAQMIINTVENIYDLVK